MTDSNQGLPIVHCLPENLRLIQAGLENAGFQACPTGKATFYQSQVNTFDRELPAHLAGPHAAIDLKDLCALRQAAHVVSSAACTMKTVGFAQLCRKVQNSAERSDAGVGCIIAHPIMIAPCLRRALESAVKAPTVCGGY